MVDETEATVRVDKNFHFVEEHEIKKNPVLQKYIEGFDQSNYIEKADSTTDITVITEASDSTNFCKLHIFAFLAR